ncbi:ribbon-helix-helix domain-containing protein [Methylobacterium sp. A49B]
MKRPSLFSAKAAPAASQVDEPAASEAPATPSPAPAAAAVEPTAAGPAARAAYPKATTRAGKRVVTAYVSPEAFRQLKRIAADEDAQVQDLLTEGLNAVFAARGLSRIA